MLQKISALCNERNISLAQLERDAGLGRNSVYRWDENRPSVDKVKLVADYFGCTIDELLEEDETEGET